MTQAENAVPTCSHGDDADACQLAHQTADRSATEGLIRDLYAIAAFYLAHPDHPRPHSMTLHHSADLDEVERVAKQYGRNGMAYGDVPQTDHDLADCSMPINLLVSSRPYPDGRAF